MKVQTQSTGEPRAPRAEADISLLLTINEFSAIRAVLKGRIRDGFRLRHVSAFAWQNLRENIAAYRATDRRQFILGGAR